MVGTRRRSAIAVAWFWASLLVAGPVSPVVRGDDRPTGDPAVMTASLSARPERQPFPARDRRGPSGGDGASAGWWSMPLGVAAALAAVGGISLAAKRSRWDFGLGSTLARDLGSIGVVGQARLSPKHAVYLVRVGDRVLIVGAGQGGSPATLGEVTDPVELGRLIPRRAGRINAATTPAPASVGRSSSARPAGFDQRIGDDE